jgi:hypothetical protein
MVDLPTLGRDGLFLAHVTQQRATGADQVMDQSAPLVYDFSCINLQQRA